MKKTYKTALVLFFASLAATVYATIWLAVVVTLVGLAVVGYTGYKIYVFLKTDRFQQIINRYDDADSSNTVYNATEKLKYYYYSGNWPTTNAQGLIPVGQDAYGNQVFAEPFPLLKKERVPLQTDAE
jgi:hypothetical protein